MGEWLGFISCAETRRIKNAQRYCSQNDIQDYLPVFRRYDRKIGALVAMPVLLWRNNLKRRVVVRISPKIASIILLDMLKNTE